jgi:hypothetical protein
LFLIKIFQALFNGYEFRPKLKRKKLQKLKRLEKEKDKTQKTVKLQNADKMQQK